MIIPDSKNCGFKVTEAFDNISLKITLVVNYWADIYKIKAIPY